MNAFRIVNSILGSNTYILYEKNRAEVWLIDCGDVELIMQWCRNQRKSIAGVFLTHTHFDHIYGLNDLLSYVPEVEIYTSPHGVQGLFSSRYNLSLFHGNPFVYRGSNVNTMGDSCKVELYTDIHLTAFYTPGHDWSCLTFLVGDYLFTGDSYIPGQKLVANFPKSDKKLAMESWYRISEMIKEGMEVCPGHGETYENFQPEVHL